MKGILQLHSGMKGRIDKYPTTVPAATPKNPIDLKKLTDKATLFGDEVSCKMTEAPLNSPPDRIARDSG